jgi:hypothetical protein
MIVYLEFRMLRDTITKIGEERETIGKEAVKDFSSIFTTIIMIM